VSRASRAPGRRGTRRASWTPRGGDSAGAGDSAGDAEDSGDLDSGQGDTGESVARPAPDQWILYAVRHAETEGEGDDPPLTTEGAARAEALAVRMTGVPLDAVYATDLLRTQQTVQPTADAHGLPVVVDVDPEEELAALIVAAHLGDTLLHAGHSYTLPGLFEVLGADEPDVTDYGQLWILTGDAAGVLEMVEERFGDEE
jgi:phosphohistidine phosphatase SixA